MIGCVIIVGWRESGWSIEKEKEAEEEDKEEEEKEEEEDEEEDEEDKEEEEERGRPKKDWMSNITMWTKKKIDELLMLTKDRDGSRKCVIGASKMIPTTIFSSRDLKKYI